MGRLRSTRVIRDNFFGKNLYFSKISWVGLETGRMRLAKTAIFKVPDEDIQRESN